jgi:two-component system LytT family sensor kinase
VSSFAQSTRQTLKALTISFVVWTAIAIAIAYQLYLNYLSVRPNTRFIAVLRLPLVRGLVYALLTPPLFYIVQRYPISRRNPALRSLLYTLGFVSFDVAYASVRMLIMPPYDPNNERWTHRSWEGLFGLMIGTFADQLTMYVAILLAAHAWALFRRDRKQELEKLDLQRALATSELQMLKMQLHPHFLFNTLHGIATLTETDASTAKQMIVKLSTLLRSALDHSSSDLVPLRTELAFVQDFLDLEKMRLGERLRVHVLCAPETGGMLVPQLLLQPVVENAIVHGIACCREGGWLQIETSVVEKRLEIRIRNSRRESSAPGTGLGIHNTCARLRHLYGDDAQFALRFPDASIAEAVITLPALGGRKSLSRNGTHAAPAEVC